MAKKNDFSDLTRRLKLSGFVDNVKSIISPTGSTPDPEEGDKIGHQLAELSLLIQDMAQVNAEQTKRMSDINKLFNEMFEELKAEREELEEARRELEGESEDDDDDEDEKPVKKKSTKAKPKATKDDDDE